ncbi:DNA primase [bacterium]|nr:DNA primase [bacterium]
MNIHEFVGYFEKSYKSGKDEYQCLCPAHDDRTASLGIKEMPDGRILINCFAGCNAGDILGAVGLSFDDIVPKRLGDFKPVSKPFNPYAVLKAISNETLLVALAALELGNGKTLPLEDRDRLIIAAERLRKAYDICH